ncbi:MAG TPA: YIP1 family protein [Azospira sp.]|nr:YIP1 family protein [Azospira sp.]
MLNRIIGVLRLDGRTYEEIEHDPAATQQAVIIVLIVGLLSAIGSGIGSQQGGFLGRFLGSLIWAFLGWMLWTVVSYFVGTRLFGGQGTLSGLFRTIGYAQAPLLLSIIPCFGPVVGGIWALITGFIAIRQAMDLDNLRAFITILVGFLFYIAGVIVLGIFLAPAALLFGR